MQIAHTAIDCRWGEPTLFVLRDPHETFEHPWACVRDREALIIRAFDDCLACARWEPRVAECRPPAAPRSAEAKKT
jgi:hypothetical protein